MNLDRPEYLNLEGGKLSKVSSEIIGLELSDEDIRRLVDPDLGYTMSRFMGFEAPVPGWAFEDKVHVWLKESSHDQPQDKVADLSLDLGGDLYFSIFKGAALSSATFCVEYDDLSRLVSSDPSDRLSTLGITIVRFYNLPELNTALQSH